MNWVDIRNSVESVAGAALPGIGGLLAGPAGAKVGSILAGVLGVANSPDAVNQALTTDPQAAVKLAQIASDERIALALQATQLQQDEVKSDAAQVAAVNTTMQTEAKAEHWPQWAWRPLVGFAFAIGFFFVVVMCCVMAIAAIFGGTPEALTNIPTIIGAFAGLFAIPMPVLGITAWHRGKMQVTQVSKTQ